MSPLRNLVSVIAVLLAAILLPVAILAPWVDRVPADTDAFVERVGPLADEPSVQRATVTALMSQAQRSLPQERTRQLRTVVTDVVEGPQFGTAWEQAIGVTHGQLLAALSDDDSPVAADGVVTVQLRPLLRAVIARFDGQQAAKKADLPPVTVSLQVASAEQLDRARTAYRIVDGLGVIAPIAWAVCVVVALLLATRRRLILAALAWSSAAALVVLWLALGAARELAIDQSSAQADELIGLVWDALVGGLRTGVLVGAGVAALLGVLTVTSGLVGRQRSA